MPRVRSEIERQLAAAEFYERMKNTEFAQRVPPCNGLGFPEEFKIESPYMIFNPAQMGDVPDGGTPRVAPMIFDEADGTTRQMRVATNALGDSQWVMDSEHREDDGSLLWDDVSIGPAHRFEEEQASIREGYAKKGPIMGAPCVKRFFYDRDGNDVAWVKLNDAIRPRGTDLDVICVCFQDAPNDHLPSNTWAWGSTEAGGYRFARCTYEKGTGRKTRLEFDTGSVQFFSGPVQQETLRFATHNPLEKRELLGDGSTAGVVSEAYRGPKGRAYLVRRTFMNGVINYYEGTIPQRCAIRKQWHPDGKILFFKGIREREYVVREGFCARSPDLLFEHTEEEAAPVDATPLPFAVGDEVRPFGLSRNDLNNRLGTVKLFIEETRRFAVCFGAGANNTFNIKPDNLISEAQFQEDRASRQANRTTAQLERDDRRAAERLARQEERNVAALAAAALAAAEAAPFDATVEEANTPVKPTSVKKSLREMVLCPLAREPMLDAVLASDGYVYSRKALQAFWKEHGFLSPLTGEECGAALFVHISIRSIARDMADSPTHAKWSDVSDDEPDMLCCPITQEVMKDPVRAADGNIYDRESLEQWFGTGKATSPLTNEGMAAEMRDDLTMRELCKAWQ